MIEKKEFPLKKNPLVKFISVYLFLPQTKGLNGNTGKVTQKRTHLVKQNASLGKKIR